LYRQAIKIESDNPRLFFDISDCYSRINKLDQAIVTLDTAILLDNSYAGFYNNRGLNYYKLDNDQNAINDFKRAIQLDSINWVFYANIALAYYSAKNQEEACNALRTSIRLGLDLSNNHDQDELTELIEVCE
jgi:tetratricopeptide (TPR) repeat protein